MCSKTLEILLEDNIFQKIILITGVKKTGLRKKEQMILKNAKLKQFFIPLDNTS